MKVLRKEPGKPWDEAAVENTLPALQLQVRGYIETVTLCTDLCIICNEEGRLRGLPYNCEIYGCHFYGPILAVGVDGDDFCDVPVGTSFFSKKDSRG